MIKRINGIEYFSLDKNVEDTIEEIVNVYNDFEKIIDENIKKHTVLYPALLDFKEYRNLKMTHINDRHASISLETVLKKGLGKDWHELLYVFNQLKRIKNNTQIIMPQDICDKCYHIKCEDEQDAVELISYLKEIGFEWYGRGKIRKGTYWGRYKELTYYDVGDGFVSICKNPIFYHYKTVNVKNIIFMDKDII